jgi:protein phosphatase-4 regulatory subunit 3
LEKRVLSPVLEVMYHSKDKDNLLSSACLELFEFIRKEDMKDFVKFLVVNHRDRLEELNYMSTFQETILRYDQTQGYTANMEFYLEADDEMARKPPQNARLMEHLAVDPNEEAYWNTSDPEDEDEQQRIPDDRSQAGSEASTSSKPLVDYTSDEEVEENANSISEQPATEETTMKQEDADDQTAPSVQPPERIAEKRRREEEDDDEIGKMMQHKRRNSNTTPGPNAPVGAGRRRKSFTAGSGNGTPKKIAISLSPALKSGGVGRSDDES